MQKCKQYNPFWKKINPKYSLNAESPIPWPPYGRMQKDAKSQLIRKDPDSGKD